MSVIKNLFMEDVVWQKIKGKNGKWFTEFNGEKYHLQMNDFPDEPLFTVKSESESMNFDDPPLLWLIPYE